MWPGRSSKKRDGVEGPQERTDSPAPGQPSVDGEPDVEGLLTLPELLSWLPAPDRPSAEATAGSGMARPQQQGTSPVSSAALDIRSRQTPGSVWATRWDRCLLPWRPWKQGPPWALSPAVTRDPDHRDPASRGADDPQKQISRSHITVLEYSPFSSQFRDPDVSCLP